MTSDNGAFDILDKKCLVESPNACGTDLSYIYFFLYTCMITFVILNLFIAVILDGFEESQHNEIADIIYTCLTTWRRYDPECTMSLPLEKALDYIDEVVEEVCKKGTQEQVSERGGKERAIYRMPRYDNQYNGESENGSAVLAYYNLHSMRVLALRVGDAPGFDVRFVVVVKAILRRLVCQCITDDPDLPIDYYGARKAQRLSNLYELENLEVKAEQHKSLKAELKRLKSAERWQQRHNVDFDDGFKDLADKISGRGSGGEIPGSPQPRKAPISAELILIEQVAAAKIQRRIKELLQRKRARPAEDANGGEGQMASSAGMGRPPTIGGPAAGEGPIMRAAG